MRYDFDRHINRRGTCSVKWSDEILAAAHGKAGLTPLWVADMDFACPQPVIDAVIREASQGVYGYSYRTAGYFRSFIGWMENRHGLILDKEWILFSSGVVSAINAIIQEFSSPGDKIIIQPPVYHPFFHAVWNNGRAVLENNLIEAGDGNYVMDYEGLERMAADPLTKIAILCSPHNPVGRVWDEDELKRFGDACIRNGVLVIADEIHCDLVFKGHKHIPFSSISEDFAKMSITCTAPSKTFNIAGLQVSNLVVSDPKLRKALSCRLEANGIEEPCIFGAVAAEVAYSEGEEWLEQVLTYLEANAGLLEGFIRTEMPGIGYRKPDSTYLAWIDFRRMGLDADSLKDLLINRAGLALNQGLIYGRAGEGFARLNFGCTRALLESSLKKLAAELAK